MTDSASLGRAVLAIDVDRSAFDAELQRVRQEVERFAPNFGGIDQVLQGVARSVGQLERALQGAGNEVEQLGRAAQQVGALQQQGFEAAGRAAQRYLTGLNGLTAQLDRLQRTPINLDNTARGIGSLGEAFNDARTAANEFVTGLINGTQRLENTTAAVSQQADALRTLAANTDTASASYRNFVNAEEIARQRLTGRLEFDRLDAVRNTFETGNVGGRTQAARQRAAAAARDDLPDALARLDRFAEGSAGRRRAQERVDSLRRTINAGNIRTSQFNGIQELLAQAENIQILGDNRLTAGNLGARRGTNDRTPLTPAILQNVIGQLEYARDNTRLSNPDLNRLTTQIERLTTLLNRTLQPLQPGQSVIPPQQLLLPPGDTTRAQFRGGAVPINRFATPADYDRPAAQEARAARLAGRLADLQAYFSPSRTSGVRETPAELQSTIDVLTRLRTSLGEANPQFRILTDQIGVLSSRLRQAERGQGVIRLRGSGSLADERAFQQAQEAAQAARDARINELRQRPAQIEFQGRNGFRDFSSGAEERVRARARQEVIDRIEAQRRVSSRSGLTGFLQDVPGIQAQLQADTAARLERQRQSLLNLDIGGGFGGGPNGPSGPRGGFRSRLLGALPQGLIGGAFPLLFGQPPAAAVGGGLGGLIGGLLGSGGGFAGGLVGTAIGQGLDRTVQSGIGLSDAVRDPIKQFQALKEAAGLSSKAVERNVESLISQGRSAEAAALIQKDLARSFGSLQEFRAYQEAQDQLTRTFERVKVSIGSLVAGPLTNLLGTIERFLSVSRGVSGAPGTPFSPERLAPLRRVNRFIEASPANRQAFERFAQRQGVTLDNLQVVDSDVGRAAARSLRLREQFGIQRGVLRGPEITDPGRAERLQAARDAAANEVANTRLNRLRGSVAFYQSSGNGLLAAQRELQAFDENRANRLAAVSKEGRPGEASKLAQERYQLELNIARERRAQNAAAEQSANKVLSLQEQTAVLRRTPFMSERDARLMQEQATLLEAERANRAAQNAAAANRKDPALQQAAQEAAAAVERAGQNYRNAVIEGAREVQRANLDTALQIRSLRERGRIADAAPGLSGTGIGALRSRAALSEVAGDYIRARNALREAPQDDVRQRAAAVAGERLRTAGKEFRSELQQAFQNAQTEAQSLRLRLSGAASSLGESLTATGPGSLNRLLPQPLVALRQNLGFQQLLPQFNAAKQYVRDNTGNQNYDINFSGSVESVNRRMLEYINAALSEQSLQLDYINATRENAKAAVSLSTVMDLTNKTLPDALTNVTKAIADLVGKDWNVYVNGGTKNSSSVPIVNNVSPQRVVGVINGTPLIV